MASPIMASGSSAQNGFWGSVLGGIGEGIGKIGSDVLPVWTAHQLGAADPGAEIDSPVNTSLGNIFGMPTAQSQFMDDVNEIEAPVQPNTVLAAGVVLIGIIVILKVL
jgi:hypothetical protein